ncbi:MAG TPA: DUF1573 domain-containing protein [Lacibacter sp.]|nr:DUF1573 domain-containing protein [Lacibacter sp.]
MKHVFLISVFAFWLSACGNTDDNKAATDNKTTTDAAVDASNFTTVQWMDSVQNFGKVVDGEKVLISFHFKNTGTKPLIISNVMAGCGCTVPSKPEEPILPGAEGVIKAEFNSAGRVGKADKYVDVVCNTQEQTYKLRFEGEVVAKAGADNSNSKQQ